MMSLVEKFRENPSREQLIKDCIDLIDTQVKKQKGVSGLAIKGAYKTVSAIKKGFVRSVVDSLLNDWLTKVQPYFSEWQKESTTSFGEFLSTKRESVSEALLSVTDQQAETADNKTAAKLYSKFRPKAAEHVKDALPGLGDILERRTNA